MKHKHIKPRRFTKKEEPYRVNERIRAREVRLVGENITPGIYNLTQALQIAQDNDKDLVEISPTASPPVCKVIDYSKFKYDRKKKLKEIQSKTQKTTVKEIRMTPNTEIHDIKFKTNHASKFLTEGSKVEAYIQYRGREAYALREKGEEKLQTLIDHLADYGKPEGPITRKGRRSMVTILPHPTKK